ncbi:MAG: rRNA maturation RNase YbeY [Flavobacteriaceae bacterium]
MILYNSETDFVLEQAENISDWIAKTIESEGKSEGDISYIFCDDDYLLDINVKYLNHNTLTDIISFDYTDDGLISGDVFVSIDRVKENAEKFNVSFQDELHRVMIHGILHFCGYKDKTKEEEQLIRSKEDYYLSLRTF